MRNVVCSVVTIAAVWALAHYSRQLADTLTAGDSLTGLALFWVVVAIFGTGCYLIARAVDSRAAKQRERLD